MTHMAFSIFYDLQIHGFGVTFATLKKRNVSCDSECPQALPGTNHSIQKKKAPVGCVPFGRLPGHLTLQSHKIDQSKLPKSSHLKLFKHLCIYIYTHTHIYI